MAYTGRGGEQLADHCRVEKFGDYSAIQPRSRAELAVRLRDDTAADVATRRRGPRDFVRVGHGPDSHDPPAPVAGRLVTGRRPT